VKPKDSLQDYDFDDTFMNADWSAR